LGGLPDLEGVGLHCLHVLLEGGGDSRTKHIVLIIGAVEAFVGLVGFLVRLLVLGPLLGFVRGGGVVVPRRGLGPAHLHQLLDLVLLDPTPQAPQALQLVGGSLLGVGSHVYGEVIGPAPLERLDLLELVVVPHLVLLVDV